MMDRIVSREHSDFTYKLCTWGMWEGNSLGG
jgi:hypothetical protein